MTSTARLADALAAAVGPLGAELSAEGAAHLAALCDRAAAAWPGIAVPDERFAAHVAARLRPGAPLVEALSEIRAADLYLACACAAGDPAAIAAFEARHLPSVRATLGRLRLSAGAIDDVVQSLRVQLLVGHGADSIAAYAGRGDLGGWVRTVAIHAAYKALRLDQRGPAGEDDELAGVAAPDLPLEVQLLRAEYAAEFRAAFDQAMAGLTARSRNLLRQHYLDGLGIDELAPLYRAHRSTLARWLAQARTDLRAGTEKALAERLALQPAEIGSLIRALDSALEISLRGLV